MAETVFWLCLAGIVLVAPGYPLAVLLLSWLRPRPWREGEEALPSVSLVTVVRGGPELAVRALENFDRLDYPRDRLEWIYYQDGPADDLPEAARGRPDIRLGATGRHLGKARAMNAAVTLARGAVLVFKDADAVYPPEALRLLVRPLADPTVGGACGLRRIGEATAAMVGGQKAYVGFDSAVKRAESRCGSLTSNDGKIYAVRRDCYEDVPDGVTDDLYVCLGVRARGLRFVLAPGAEAVIPAPVRDGGHEIERRRRIVSTSLRGLWLRRALLDPRRHGAYALALGINKVLRRFVPVLLLGLAAASLVLAGESRFFALVAVGGLSFLLLALCGSPASSRIARWRRPGRPSRRPGRTPARGRLGRLAARLPEAAWYFLLGAIGTLWGLIDFLRGRRVVTWTPAQRPIEGEAMPRFVLILVVLASLASPAAPARAAGPCLLGQDLPAGFRAFAPDSPWNAPIAAKAAVDPQSGAMIHSLAARGGPLAPSTRKWTVPVFVIDAKNCPTVSVPTRSDVLHPSVDPDGDRRADLPLPEGVWPDPSEDAHMVMVDPRAGKAWELSGVRLAGGRVASANRIYVWDLSGPGFVKPPFSGSAWWAVGATAAGLPLIGGVVGLAEFEAGRIDHALIGGVPNTRKSRQPGGPNWNCARRPRAPTARPWVPTPSPWAPGSSSIPPSTWPAWACPPGPCPWPRPCSAMASSLASRPTRSRSFCRTGGPTARPGSRTTCPPNWPRSR